MGQLGLNGGVGAGRSAGGAGASSLWSLPRAGFAAGVVCPNLRILAS